MKGHYSPLTRMCMHDMRYMKYHYTSASTHFVNRCTRTHTSAPSCERLWPLRHGFSRFFSGGGLINHLVQSLRHKIAGKKQVMKCFRICILESLRRRLDFSLPSLFVLRQVLSAALTVTRHESPSSLLHIAPSSTYLPWTNTISVRLRGFGGDLEGFFFFFFNLASQNRRWWVARHRHHADCGATVDAIF